MSKNLSLVALAAFAGFFPRLSAEQDAYFPAPQASRPSRADAEPQRVSKCGKQDDRR